MYLASSGLAQYFAVELTFEILVMQFVFPSAMTTEQNIIPSIL